MKILLLTSLLLIGVYGFPREPEGCTFCKESVKKLFDKALETEAQQEYLLSYGVRLLFLRICAFAQ